MITGRWSWVPALAALGRDDSSTFGTQGKWCAAAFSSRYFRPFAMGAQYQIPPTGARLGPLRNTLLRFGARNFNHVRPFLDVFAQIGVELGGRHHQRHRALLVPGLLHVGAGDHLVDLGVELID